MVKENAAGDTCRICNPFLSVRGHSVVIPITAIVAVMVMVMMMVMAITAGYYHYARLITVATIIVIVVVMVVVLTFDEKLSQLDSSIVGIR
jgi:hypothetical protein